MRTARSRHASASFTPKCLWVGILLLLVLFGHHALEATEAQAGHAAMSSQVLSLGATMDHAGHEVTEVDSTSSPANQHPSRPDIDCGANSPAAAIQGSGSFTQVLPPPMADAAPPDSHGFGSGSSFEPITSPGVRRALLQVYRI